MPPSSRIHKEGSVKYIKAQAADRLSSDFFGYGKGWVVGLMVVLRYVGNGYRISFK